MSQTSPPLMTSDIPPAPPGTFSIAVLPDTQDYIPAAPHIFAAEIDWILNNLETQNIRFVSHLGDVVDDCRLPSQWQTARDILLQLDGRVPFGFSPGNRDMSPDGDSTAFQNNFPETLFRGRPWYGGGYKNNADSFQLIEAEGVELIILHLECNAPDDVLAWADEVAAKYPNRNMIAVCHMYLGPLERPTTAEGWFTDPKGRMRWVRRHGERGNSPQQIWDKFLCKHRNLFLVCCGDQSRTQAMRTTSLGLHGNAVHECLSDYRDGYLRLYRFHVKQPVAAPERQAAGASSSDHEAHSTLDRVEVFTYSPRLKMLCPGTQLVPDVGEHQFTLPLA